MNFIIWPWPHDRTRCTYMNTINIKRAVCTYTLNQGFNNFIVPLKSFDVADARQVFSSNTGGIRAIKSFLKYPYRSSKYAHLGCHLSSALMLRTVYISTMGPISHFTSRLMGQQPSFYSWLIFSHQWCTTPCPRSEITHDLSTDGVVPLAWCHSKSPSKPIPSNHVTGRIHSSTAPSLSTAFPPEAEGVSIQFLHRSRAKKGKEIRSEEY